jgi:hypothetical protein
MMVGLGIKPDNIGRTRDIALIPSDTDELLKVFSICQTPWQAHNRADFMAPAGVGEGCGHQETGRWVAGSLAYSVLTPSKPAETIQNALVITLPGRNRKEPFRQNHSGTG